jgi:hypothetical protein
VVVLVHSFGEEGVLMHSLVENQKKNQKMMSVHLWHLVYFQVWEEESHQRAKILPRNLKKRTE